MGWGLTEQNSSGSQPLSAARAASTISTRTTRATAAAATGNNVLLVKGAAECVIDRSTTVMTRAGPEPMTAAGRKALLDTVNEMAGRALRVLAVARKDGPALGALASYDGESSHPAHGLLMDSSKYSDIESGLTLLGLVAIRDPPRPEVRSSVLECVEAGIRIMVITGDNKNTAEAVAREIGLFSADEPLSGLSFTGHEFQQLPAEEQRRILATAHACVFSRAEPAFKQEIVRILKEQVGGGARQHP